VKRDLPPGSPPEVHYFGVKENDWVLREGKMPYLSGTKTFIEDEMNYLRGIEKHVEAIVGK
jgi:hypothetical protein